METKKESFSDHISSIQKCTTENSKALCIFNVAQKLQQSGIYDIGGTYTDDKPELWFYFVTSVSHGDNYLFNLFVMTREPTDFTIMLPKDSRLPDFMNIGETSKENSVRPTHEAFTFHSKTKDENIFLKTYAFTKKEIDILENHILLLPIKITVNTRFTVSDDVVRTIQYYHNSTGILVRDSNTDYKIESLSGQTFGVHKILLAASSSVFLNLIKTNEHLLKVDLDDSNIEILLEFLYTGAIINTANVNHLSALEIAEKFQFGEMSSWVQDVICKDINVNNAVDIAVLAKKLKKKNLSEIVFAFIKKHPEVLNTDAWKSIEDVLLIKSLLSYLHDPDQQVQQDDSCENHTYVTFTPRFPS